MIVPIDLLKPVARRFAHSARQQASARPWPRDLHDRIDNRIVVIRDFREGAGGLGAELPATSSWGGVWGGEWGRMGGGVGGECRSRSARREREWEERKWGWDGVW